jgi:hypothetical protein
LPAKVAVSLLKLVPMSKCQHLSLYAQDPRLPFRLDYVTGKYYLDLGKDTSVEVQHCPTCGDFQYQEQEPCKCSRWGEWASNPDVPIEFDQEVNEFHLFYGKCYMIIRYCPLCGGPMPESTCGKLFTEPSQEEIDTIQRLLSSARTIEAVIEKLGPPDEKFPAIVADPIDRILYGTRDVKRSMRYSSRWKTLVLTVIENEDGRIAFAYSGQYKGSRV